MSRTSQDINIARSQKSKKKNRKKSRRSDQQLEAA
jgi:hypothetical protein